MLEANQQFVCSFFLIVIFVLGFLPFVATFSFSTVQHVPIEVSKYVLVKVSMFQYKSVCFSMSLYVSIQVSTVEYVSVQFGMYQYTSVQVIVFGCIKRLGCDLINSSAPGRRGHCRGPPFYQL